MHSLSTREGSCVPELIFKARLDGQWVEVNTHPLFEGKGVCCSSCPVLVRRPAPAATGRAPTNWRPSSENTASTA